jgi:NifB/MoaA-like Fe-S oxidoreductase
MAKKKLTKKQKRQLARLALACLAFILVISIPVGLIIFFTNNADGATFKTVDRVKHIKKEKKKEKDAKGYATIGWLRVQGTNIDAPIIKYDSMEGMEEVNKEDFLWNEYMNAKEEKVTPNCKMKCSVCGANTFKAGICVQKRGGNE